MTTQTLTNTDKNVENRLATMENYIRKTDEDRDGYIQLASELMGKLTKYDRQIVDMQRALHPGNKDETPRDYTYLLSPTSSSRDASGSATPTPDLNSLTSSNETIPTLQQMDVTIDKTHAAYLAKIRSAEKECDLYRDFCENLCGLMEERAREIRKLEATPLPPTPAIPVPAAASPAPKQKAVDPRELALRALVEDMDHVQGTIDLSQRDKVLHNLIFIKYCELKKEKHETVNLDSLSESDRDLEQAARVAVQQVDPSYNVLGMIRSFIEKKNEVVKHIKSQILNKENTVKDYGSATSITQLIGHAVDTVFAHYDAMYKYHSQRKSLKREMTYKDFPFREFPLFAGELFLLKTRLQQLDQLCEKIPSKSADHAKSIRLRMTIASHIENINTLEESYSRLLKRCRVKP